MTQLVERCELDFADFAESVFQQRVDGVNELNQDSKLGVEVAQGMFNMRILGAALDRSAEPGPALVNPFVLKAFRLASRGRLKLTAELPARPCG